MCGVWCWRRWWWGWVAYSAVSVELRKMREKNNCVFILSNLLNDLVYLLWAFFWWTFMEGNNILIWSNDDDYDSNKKRQGVVLQSDDRIFCILVHYLDRYFIHNFNYMLCTCLSINITLLALFMRFIEQNKLEKKRSDKRTATWELFFIKYGNWPSHIKLFSMWNHQVYKNSFIHPSHIRLTII